MKEETRSITARWLAIGLASLLLTTAAGCGSDTAGENASDSHAVVAEDGSKRSGDAGGGERDRSSQAGSNRAGAGEDATAARDAESTAPRIEDMAAVAGSLAPGAAEARHAAAAGDEPFVWPERPTAIAVLDIKGHGEIQLGLYAQLAPATVAQFIQLATDGSYEGTLFHRVIEGFMIQGGDLYTKKTDPGAAAGEPPRFSPPDEFNAAPHERGALAMANRGRPGSATTQFFIVHQDTPSLDGKYTVFGRVLDGMEVVDSVAETETDKFGRWIEKDRPLEEVVLAGVWIDTEGGVEFGAGLGAESDLEPGPETPPAAPVP